MIRLATLFWLLLVAASGFAMFGVKYAVQTLDDELGRTRKASAAEERETRVLDAEWAYLTRPDTLEDMNRRFLSLTPIATGQLRTGVADIPMRPPPPPPPPAPPEPVPDAVAAAETSPPVAPTAPPAPAEPAPTLVAAVTPAPEPAAAATPKPVAAAVAPAPRAIATAKAAPKREAPRRPKSLDELIAQISAAR
jgi:hypothetical protein